MLRAAKSRTHLVGPREQGNALPAAAALCIADAGSCVGEGDIERWMVGCRDTERGSWRLAGCTGHTTSLRAGDPTCIQRDEVLDQRQTGLSRTAKVGRQRRSGKEESGGVGVLTGRPIRFGKAYYPFQICLYVRRKVHHQYMNIAGQCTFIPSKTFGW